MGAESEGDVFGRVSIHAEFVGVLEHLRVAICRTEGQQHPGAGRNGHGPDLVIGFRCAVEALDR